MAVILIGNMEKLPEWLSSALFGAAIAAIGYVAKSLIELYVEYRARQRERRSQLIRLRSLLSVTRVSFDIQLGHARRLSSMLKHRNASLDDKGGFEEIFEDAYATFTSEEKELHTIIRSITAHSTRPANAAIVSWLEKDTYFQGQPHGDNFGRQMAEALGKLDTHLRLWEAKYQVWIPDHPEHALVFLADEKEHRGLSSRNRRTCRRGIEAPLEWFPDGYYSFQGTEVLERFKLDA
jgi:hypothetical protein